MNLCPHCDQPITRDSIWPRGGRFAMHFECLEKALDKAQLELTAKWQSKVDAQAVPPRAEP